jgi:hypothetical protein
MDANEYKEQQEQIDAQVKRVQQKYAKQLDYKLVFSSDEGRRVLKDLMKSFSLDTTTFAVRHDSQGFMTPDPYTTIYNEGQRSVVLGIMKMVHEEPIDLMNEIKKIENSVQEKDWI